MSSSWGSPPCRDTRRWLNRLFLAVLLVPGVALPATLDAGGPSSTMTVVDLIAELEDRGEVFVYSTDLVRPSSVIEIPERGPLTVDDLRRGLEALNLTLERGRGDTWLIVPLQLVVDPGAASGSLEGRVKDAQSGKPLAGVKVEIGGITTYTDVKGRFSLPVSGARAVQVSHDGYMPRQLETQQSLSALLEIPLDPYPRIEEVIVVSSRYALRGGERASQHSIDAYEVDAVPELGDDALRVANHLPGAASIGLSAQPHFRGGLRDETLVLFNGVELLEPFHLRDFQSVFSGFNPSLVKSVDVYTGGFPARYGDRMSAVMDIEPADDADRFGAEVLLSFLTASASAVGVVDDGRGRWSASARRGNLDMVVDLVNSRVGDPTYSDLFGSFAYALTPETDVEVGFIAYNDDVLLKDLDEGDGEQAHSRYENAYGWMQVHHDWGPRQFSSSVLSYGNIDHRRDGFINDDDLEEGSSSLKDRRSFDLWQLGHRHQWDYSDLVDIEFGGQYAYQRGNYDSVAVLRRGALAEIVGLPEEEDRLVATDPEGASGDAYGSIRVLPREWVALELGLRWDFQDFGTGFEQQISPRLSARVDLSEHTQLRGSMGRFHQAEQIHELQAADGESRFQLPQYSDHYILGLNHRFADSGLSARIEAFYKRVKKPKQRYENLFNALVLMPELASDRVSVDPQEARVRGFEATMRYERDSNFRSWFSYSRSRAEDQLNGRWERRGWDQTHSISSGFIWQSQAWTLSAAVLWHSGWQTTGLPDVIEADSEFVLDRNNTQLPDYLSVDVRLARTWEWPRQSLTLFAEVTNLLDHKNIGAYEYDLEEDEDTGAYLISSEPVDLLPLVPAIGVRWTFN